LRKSLDFRRVLVTDVARTVTQGVVSIVLAATGAGAWAIVWGYVAGSATWTASAWLVAGYRPHPDFVRRFSRPVAKRLLAYGAPAAAQGLLAALIFDVDYLIVGRVLGAEALGAYALAFRLPQVVIISVLGILSSVAFPLFSRARGEPARLKRGYLASIRLQSAYGAAAAVLLLMVAPMAVDVVFGAKWHASIVPLQALALYAAARSLGFGAVDVYKGIGRPGLAAGVALVRLAVLVPALLLAADRGIDAVAWTQAALALAFAIGMQGAAARIIGLRLADFGAALRPAAALAAGTAAGAAAARWGLAGPEGVRFVAAVAAGACGGLAALWVVDVQFLRDTRALLARGRSRSEVVAT
jgi:PST family polysaccharide transporter